MRVPKGPTGKVNRASLVIDLRNRSVYKDRYKNFVLFTDDDFLFVMEVKNESTSS